MASGQYHSNDMTHETPKVNTEQVSLESAQSASNAAAIEQIAPEQTTNAEQTAELARLRAELDALRLERDAAKEEASVAHRNAAAKAAAAPSARLNTAAQDLARNKVIAAVGGLGRYNQLPTAERFKLNGAKAPTQADFDEAVEYFSPRGSGAAAASLAKNDPARYLYLRLCSLEGRR